jgi:Arc/MetJ-type ribon-helix-helix transcriptional regulator
VKMRYTRSMSHQIPLTPVQEQIVRDLLASGRFQSEDDIVHAAFRLLETESFAIGASAWRHRPSTAISTAKESGRGAFPSGKEASAPSPARRSPYGIFSDIGSDISAEEIAEARHEMWAGFPHGEP